MRINKYMTNPRQAEDNTRHIANSIIITVTGFISVPLSLHRAWSIDLVVSMLRAMVGFCHFPTAALCRGLLPAEQQVCPAIVLTVFSILLYPCTYVSTLFRHLSIPQTTLFFDKEKSPSPIKERGVKSGLYCGY